MTISRNIFMVVYFFTRSLQLNVALGGNIFMGVRRCYNKLKQCYLLAVSLRHNKKRERVCRLEKSLISAITSKKSWHHIRILISRT